VWLGEVLQRQGWWVTRHDTEREAEAWVTDRVYAEEETVNPVRDFRIHEWTPTGRLPQPPGITFDESW
jgi:hypothetical protein